MANATPLKFEFDVATPSSLAEFTATNTVPVINGGTGVSSLELLGASLSSIDLSSTWVSATNITATNVSATTVSATHIYAEKGVSSTTVSGSYLIAANEVSATTASATHILAEKGVSSTTVSGSYLIAANEVSATTASATHILAESGVSSTTASSTYVIAAIAASSLLVSATDILAEGGVSANSLSATTITADSAMPIPAPYGFVQMTSNGTATDTEQNVGIGCITGPTESSTDDLEWDDTNKRWDINKTGEYEITLSVVLTVAATTTVTLQLYSTSPGTSQLSADARVHSSIDPHIYTVSWIGTIAGGGYAFATTVDDGGTDITVNVGTTLTVKRLK